MHFWFLGKDSNVPTFSVDELVHGKQLKEVGRKWILLPEQKNVKLIKKLLRKLMTFGIWS